MTFSVLAIIATYNEQRFIAGCIEHYVQHGVQVHIIDNESTDDTVAIARSYLGRGVVGIDTLPRRGRFSLSEQLHAKEAVAQRSKADWIIHADADEFRLPPDPSSTLGAALAAVDKAGYSAVNFLEFTFVPTIEEPDHDHDRFVETMRWYYHFAPQYPHHIKAWKRMAFPNIDLAGVAGHRIVLEPDQLSPVDFPFRHYLCLSLDHAARKYVQKVFDADEVSRGWHGWRSQAGFDELTLPSRDDLLPYDQDGRFDAARPVTGQHLIYRPK